MIDDGFVRTALLRHNFLPMQKQEKEEMPPILSSESFSEDVGRALAALGLRRNEHFKGYDIVEYRLTRFNGVPRVCGIPHPLAHAFLVERICESWSRFEYVLLNERSKIRPQEHEGGRLFVMDYEETLERFRRLSRNGFACRFVVHTDISNCFPSIYSHAISWALVGIPEAKRRQRASGEWFNQLDVAARSQKRNETIGVPIGPATSNLLAETILARVDERLSEKGYVFDRYVDDYTAYCSDENAAQEFVIDLSRELALYKLSLSIGKTTIAPLPAAIVDDWVSWLALALPQPGIQAQSAIHFLNGAVAIAGRSPDGSVLKYALKALLKCGIAPGSEADVLGYAVVLAFHHPVLLPLLGGLFDSLKEQGRFAHGIEISRIAANSARMRRSDALAWTIYYLARYGVEIAEEIANEVLGASDCIGLTLLHRFGDQGQREAVVRFAQSLDRDDLYVLDQHWLLLYELYRAGEIDDCYGDGCFDVLRDGGVAFLVDDVVRA